MTLRHALLGIVVRENPGAGGVQRRVVVDVIEMPVRVDDRFQGTAADCVERFFELGPGGQNESVDHKLAIGPFKHGHVSAGTGEQGEVFGKRLWVDRNGGHLRAKRGKRVCRRRALLLRQEGNRSAQQRRRGELRQEGAARERGGVAQHRAPRSGLQKGVAVHEVFILSLGVSLLLRLRRRLYLISGTTSSDRSRATRAGPPGSLQRAAGLRLASWWRSKALRSRVENWNPSPAPRREPHTRHHTRRAA